MISRKQNLGLPRQVVAWYLFFCLAAICWLATGLLEASHEVVRKRQAESAVSRLARSVATMESSFQQSQWQGLDQALAHLRSHGQFVYCSLLDTAGVAVADTRESMIGLVALEPEGTIIEESGVWGTRVQQESGLILTEYRVPLFAGGTNFGTLVAASAQANPLSLFAETINAAPSAVAIPFLLILGGGLLLAKLTQPAATVESQLQRLATSAPGEPVEISDVPAEDLTGLGWNRLVEALEASDSTAQPIPLEERIAALATDDTNDQLAEALSSLSEGIALTDAEGRLRFANGALKALLDSEVDLSSEVIFAEHLLTLVEDLDDENAFKKQTRSRHVSAEATRRVNGMPHVIRIVREPNIREVGTDESCGHVWLVRDVTQQKLAEKSRDRFLDAATHELRTPLANIKAYAETLANADSLEIEQQKEFCNTINSEVTRLSRFVDDLLSISSLEVGSLSVDLRPTDMKRLFDEVLDKVRPLLGQKGHKLDVRLPEKLVEMRIDKDKVVAVLVNLLGNAAKYTPRGGHIGLKVKRSENGLQIAVEDTGVGIAPNETEKVFEKFFRSEDPRVQDETGSGLGLSLAREVARMHGGDVVCESVLNEGTTFTLDLPSAEEVAHARR